MISDIGGGYLRVFESSGGNDISGHIEAVYDPPQSPAVVSGVHLNRTIPP